MGETTAGLHSIPLEPHATRKAVFRAARSPSFIPAQAGEPGSASRFTCAENLFPVASPGIPW